MPHPHKRGKGWRIFGLALIAGLGAAGLYAWMADASSPEPVVASQQFPWSQTPGTPGASSAAGHAGGTAGLSATELAALAATSAGDPDGSGGPRPRPFRVDARGQLVTDQTLRLELESLLALHQGAAQTAALEAQLSGLPAAAAAQARQLLNQFASYQEAQRQAFPPDQPPLMPEEGLAQLNALQSLRATYLGAENARQMFAQDDAVSRRLLELMREDSSPNLSMSEKAVRAQARYDMERNGAQP